MKLSYDEISPLTGMQTVLVEDDTKMCMVSGYMTHTDWIVGTPQIDAFEFACPEHLKDSRFVSENGQVWYKVVLIQGNTILYPDMIGGDSYWIVGAWRGRRPEESLDDRYMIRFENGEPKILDTDTSKTFKEAEFEDAYDYFQKIINESTID